MFNDRFAKRMATRYRNKGLDKTARRMVDLLTERGAQGATVLEIGGGVGEIQLELLRRGAASATNPSYHPTTRPTRRRSSRRPASLTGCPAAWSTSPTIRQRSSRRTSSSCIGWSAAIPTTRSCSAWPPATPATSSCSVPPRNPVSRAVVATQNLLLRPSGREFRAFAHPTDAMLAVLAECGMRPRAVLSGRVWQFAAATR